SKPFGVPTMLDFVRIFDKEFGKSMIYADIKSAFDETFDLETLMTVLEDLSKSEKDLFETISPQTARFLLERRRTTKADHSLGLVPQNEASGLLNRIKSIIRTECNKAIDKESTIIKVYDDFFNFLNNVNSSAKIPSPSGSLWSMTDYGSGQNPRVLPTDLRIFTTNYDQCLETYLNRKQIETCRGIVPRFD